MARGVGASGEGTPSTTTSRTAGVRGGTGGEGSPGQTGPYWGLGRTKAWSPSLRLRSEDFAGPENESGKPRVTVPLGSAAEGTRTRPSTP